MNVYRNKDDHRLSRNRENRRRDQLLVHSGHSSSRRLDCKNYSEKRKSFLELYSSEDRKRRNLDHDSLSR